MFCIPIPSFGKQHRENFEKHVNSHRAKPYNIIAILLKPIACDSWLCLYEVGSELYLPILNVFIYVVAFLSRAVAVGIFDNKDWQQEVALRSAVARINKDRMLLPKINLDLRIEHVSPYDSFSAGKKGKFTSIIRHALLFVIRIWRPE